MEPPMTDQQQEARWKWVEGMFSDSFRVEGDERGFVTPEVFAQRMNRFEHALAGDHGQADVAEALRRDVEFWKDQARAELLQDAVEALRAENAELRRGGEFAVSKANEYSQLADDWRRRAEAAELRAEALATALELQTRRLRELAERYHRHMHSFGRFTDCEQPICRETFAYTITPDAALDAHRAEAPKKN